MKAKKPVERLLPGRYGQMDAAELNAEVAKFDREFIADTAKPLTAKERLADLKAKRKRGRPRVGKGARRVLVTIESELLRRSDVYAAHHGLSRSALVARGLQQVLRKTS
jgi:hypothetical protein